MTTACTPGSKGNPSSVCLGNHPTDLYDSEKCPRLIWLLSTSQYFPKEVVLLIVSFFYQNSSHCHSCASFLVNSLEQAERFHEMVLIQKEAILWNLSTLRSGPTPEELKMYSVGNKNLANDRRSSIKFLEDNRETEPDTKKQVLIENYISSIRGELNQQCLEVLKFVDYVIDHVTPQCRCSVLKIRGDYCRYYSWHDPTYQDKSLEAYQEGLTLSKQLFDVDHPIRLALCLNYSVLIKEEFKQTEKAILIAKQGFDEMISGMTMCEDLTRDSTVIAQLLRDNTTMWMAELEREEKEGKMEAPGGTTASADPQVTIAKFRIENLSEERYSRRD